VKGDALRLHQTAARWPVDTAEGPIDAEAASDLSASCSLIARKNSRNTNLAAMRIGDERDDAGTEGGSRAACQSAGGSAVMVLPQERQSARCGFRVVTGLIGGNPRGHAGARALGADAFHHQPKHGGSARKPLAGWANICPGEISRIQPMLFRH
jgi:hypothetical protein